MIMSLSSLRSALCRRLAAARDASTLRRLDRVHLADLGIRRDQIDAYVRGEIQTDPPLAPLQLSGEVPRRLRPVLRVIHGGATRVVAGAREAGRPRLRVAVRNG